MESWSLGGGWMSLPCTPQPPGHHQLVSPSQPNTRGYQNFTCKAEGQRCARHPVTKHPLCSRDRHGVISLQLAGVHVQRLTKVHLVFSASERVWCSFFFPSSPRCRGSFLLPFSDESAAGGERAIMWSGQRWRTSLSVSFLINTLPSLNCHYIWCSFNSMYRSW